MIALTLDIVLVSPDSFYNFKHVDGSISSKKLYTDNESISARDLTKEYIRDVALHYIEHIIDSNNNKRVTPTVYIPTFCKALVCEKGDKEQIVRSFQAKLRQDQYIISIRIKRYVCEMQTAA